MKWFEIFLPMLLLMSILAPIAHAESGGGGGIDISGLVGAINGSGQQTSFYKIFEQIPP